MVGAASGAVGAIAGQLAKLKGCRVVGVAGGADKCRYVVDELGFDACLDRREPDLAGRLKAACPDGVDVYVELVGGELLWAVLPLFNLHAPHPGDRRDRLVQPGTPARRPRPLAAALAQRPDQAAARQGMIVYDVAELEPDFRRTTRPWVRSAGSSSRRT